jgi:hypothetical protein
MERGLGGEVMKPISLLLYFLKEHELIVQTQPV